MIPASRQKILIVDDEPLICTLLARMIEPLGHEVSLAHNGEDALTLCCQVEFDLVISDIKMPRMDGLTLLRSLREREIDAAFIILTAYGDLGTALAARDKYNVYNYLLKPIAHPEQFLFEVASALSRRALARDNRKLMEALQRSNEHLELKVRERTHELERKNEELNRLSNFRADVLRVLGHELRTPLGLVRGYVTLCQAEAGTTTQDYLSRIRGSTERLQQIVDNAIANLRSAEPGFQLNRTFVQPAELCREVLQRIAPLIEDRDLSLMLEPAGPLPSCRWDRAKIEAVVEELLVNAVRFTPDGGGVRIKLCRLEDAVGIAVEDTGCGVPTEERERIFEPFVTLGSADHHSSGHFRYGAQGIGLGLSTASMWVRLHHGTLTAEPLEDGKGSRFAMTLPIR